jgi:hypothetical protein
MIAKTINKGSALKEEKKAGKLSMNLIGIVDVQSAFDEALKKCNYTLPFTDQATVKPVLLVMVDLLVGKCYPNERPWLCANGVKDLANDGKITYSKTSAFEYMLDVSVWRNDIDPYEPLITGESEAFKDHDITESSSSDNSDYLWDLYKLLHVPSPLRLFFARTTEKKCPILQERISHIVTCYAKYYFDGDRLFSLVLSAYSPRTAWNGWEKKKCDLIALDAK